MRFLYIMLFLSLVLTLGSCYSVRFQVENGQWEPQDTEDGDPYYSGYHVRQAPKKTYGLKGLPIPWLHRNSLIGWMPIW